MISLPAPQATTSTPIGSATATTSSRTSAASTPSSSALRYEGRPAVISRSSEEAARILELRAQVRLQEDLLPFQQPLPSPQLQFAVRRLHGGMSPRRIVLVVHEHDERM